MISVIVPAHQEEASIADCLRALMTGSRPDEVEVVVVANGCTDRTAAIARSFGPPVRVLELPEASKIAALNAGDRVATAFPRVYLDADVLITSVDLRRVVARLDDAPVVVAAPRPELVTDSSPWLVRSYIRFWSALPSVQGALAGSGVLAVSRTGRQRFDEFPDVIADDRFLETRYERHERAIATDASSYVHAPSTVRGLIRRRTRVVVGNRQLAPTMADTGDNRSRAGDVVLAVRRRPRLLLDLPTFLAITVVARLRGRYAEARKRTVWEHGR